MRIISWNINRAASTRTPLWKYLKKLNFDIGLLQEVYTIPYTVRKNYYTIRGEMLAILINKQTIPIHSEEIIKVNTLNIYSHNDYLMDFSISCELDLSKNPLSIINIYNYMSPNEKDFLEFLDFLWRYIRNNIYKKTIIVGGDFNMDKRFKGRYKKWGDIICDIKKTFSLLGFKEVVSKTLGNSVYTFLSPLNKQKYQLDYLFIPEHIKITNIRVGPEETIFSIKPKLSDHLPIICDINL